MEPCRASCFILKVPQFWLFYCSYLGSCLTMSIKMVAERASCYRNWVSKFGTGNQKKNGFKQNPEWVARGKIKLVSLAYNLCILLRGIKGRLLVIDGILQEHISYGRCNWLPGLYDEGQHLWHTCNSSVTSGKQMMT